MRHGISEDKAEKLAQELKDLETQGDDKLKDHWRGLYGTETPRKIHRSLLIAAIAYRMQENALGGLKPSGHRHLTRAPKRGGWPTSTGFPGPESQSRNGWLVRDWGGVTHQVTVLEDGVLFRGKGYRSLSEVARVITGSALVGATVLRPQIRG